MKIIDSNIEIYEQLQLHDKYCVFRGETFIF